MDKMDRGPEKNNLPKTDEKAFSGANLETSLANRETPQAAQPEAKPPITEAEARLLLQQETRKTEAKLLTADKKNKKLIKAAIIIGVILCVAGAAIALVMTNMRKPDTSNQGTGNNQQVDTDKDQSTASNNNNITKELDINSELVQKLYRQFDSTRVGLVDENIYGILRGLNGENQFVGKPAAGEGTEMSLAKIGIALSNLETQQCKMVDLTQRYATIASWITQDDIDANGYNLCYDGEAAKNKITEIFGEDIAFYPLRQEQNTNGQQINLNSIPSGHKVYAYDPEYDEFYPIPYGSEGKSQIGGLYAAEQKGNQIYLYDFQAALRCTPYPILDEEDNVVDTSSSCRVNDMDNYDELIYEWTGKENELTIEKMLEMKETFPKFKWTFTKTPQGNYIFEKLEKVK